MSTTTDPTFDLTPDRYAHGRPTSPVTTESQTTVQGLRTPEVEKIINAIPGNYPGRSSVSACVVVRIGGPSAPDAKGDGKFGQVYFALSGDLAYDNRVGLVLQIPEAVAEVLRQQGVRTARREIQNALGL